MDNEKLILLPLNEYVGINRDDPIRLYKTPFFGRLYVKRIELCLSQCTGGEKVLEVGYGAGVSFFNLAKKYNKIYGIDLASNAGQIYDLFASKGLQVKLQQGNVLQLPYNDDEFDTVLLISILEHIHSADLPRTFQEINRVLKKGGQMVYGTPVDSLITRMGFLTLGYNIKKYHYSNEIQIFENANKYFHLQSRQEMKSDIIKHKVYEVVNFIKQYKSE